MKTIKLTLTTLAFLTLIATTGCIDGFSIRGNGIDGSETRHTSTFDKVKSSGSFNVHISNGDEFEVIVMAETNILPYIETDVYGSSLSISIRSFHNVRNTLPMEVYVTMPYLEELKVSGSGDITTGYFECNHFDAAVSGSGQIETSVDCHNFDANISGSGTIMISGVADNSEFKISGSGTIDSYDLYSTDCRAVISGSGDIYTNVDRLLEATISGSGNVFFIGDPNIIQHISGSGKVINDN